MANSLDMKKKIYIFGGDSTALEIHEAVRLADQQRVEAERYEGIFFVVPRDEDPDDFNRISIDSLDQHVGDSRQHRYIISMSDQSVRAACNDKAMEVGLRPESVIHPFAFVSNSATIQDGAYLAAYSVVSNEARVGSSTIINYHALVGHHTEIDKHVIINPGARISGRCRIGARSTIGANSFVHQGKSIGDDVMIDAMTYVDRDVPSQHILSVRNKDGRPVRRPFVGSNGA